MKFGELKKGSIFVLSEDGINIYLCLALGNKRDIGVAGEPLMSFRTLDFWYTTREWEIGETNERIERFYDLKIIAK